MLSSTFLAAFTTPITYALLAVLTATAVLQIKYVNQALQRFDATQVIPVQFVMFTLSVIIGSAVLYRDFERATASTFAKFIAGCGLTFFGVFLITSGRRRPQEAEEMPPVYHDEERAASFHDLGSTDIRSKEDHERPRFLFTTPEVATSDYIPYGERRSSRVSFREPTDRPKNRRTSSHMSPAPQHDEGNGLASETTPLLVATTSTPTSTPDLRRPSTARSVTTDATSDPQRARRPSTPSRALSMAMITPGPYMSPLSAGLSVVFAESLRENERTLRSRTQRSRTLGTLPRDGAERRPFRHQTCDVACLERATGDRRGDERSRSMTETEGESDTFGEFMR